MKVERPFEDIEPVSAGGRQLPGNVHLSTPAKTMESNEINLVGCTSEEALERLDKFLDDAFLGQLPSVRIIHGSGMGVLRRAIGEFLETHPHVSGFEFAPASQGGRGVTVAILND